MAHQTEDHLCPFCNGPITDGDRQCLRCGKSLDDFPATRVRQRANQGNSWALSRTLHGTVINQPQPGRHRPACAWLAGVGLAVLLLYLVLTPWPIAAAMDSLMSLAVSLTYSALSLFGTVLVMIIGFMMILRIRPRHRGIGMGGLLGKALGACLKALTRGSRVLYRAVADERDSITFLIDRDVDGTGLGRGRQLTSVRLLHPGQGLLQGSSVTIRGPIVNGTLLATSVLVTDSGMLLRARTRGASLAAGAIVVAAVLATLDYIH